MLKKYQPALLLTLKPSKRLKQLVVFVHTLALGACIANALAITIKISLLAIICSHFWLSFRRINAEQYTIKYTDAFGWEISEGHGFAPIEILKSTVITTFALFLHFKQAPPTGDWKSGAKKTLLVLKDALTEDDYRHLIVKLKTTT
jgi:toxin CptA